MFFLSWHHYILISLILFCYILKSNKNHTFTSTFSRHYIYICVYIHIHMHIYTYTYVYIWPMHIYVPWELDCEENWALNNWCFWTVVVENTLESPLDCKGIQPVHSKGDQPCVFIGRADAKAETPILWPPDVKSWLIGKDLDAGRGWGQEEKGMIEDEMAGWHHQFNGHEFEWTLGVGDGQGGLACCDSWGCKESDTTERLNWTELTYTCSEISQILIWNWQFIPPLLGVLPAETPQHSALFGNYLCWGCLFA